MDLKVMGWGGIDWIHVDKNRDQWRVLVSTVIKFRVAKKCEIFLSS
jgi:hypothetical protein